MIRLVALVILLLSVHAYDDYDDDFELSVTAFNLLLAAGTAASILAATRTRDPSALDQRRCWDEYLQRHRNGPLIRRHIRMSLESFEKLLEYIRADLEVNHEMASLRGGAILPEICLFCTLRWLAGGSYLDIQDLMGISRPSFYRVVWKTIQAICSCKELEIHFPDSFEECKAAANGFASKTVLGVIANCVGALDGYLLRIKTPSKIEAGTSSYFSGYYQCYGVNIQAACDYLGRFIFFAVAAPGSTGDAQAVKQCGLDELLSKLPPGFVVIADAAYTASERIASLYCGVDRKNPLYDSFNFYASQCQIRIEMALGLMQQKWGILHRPLECNLVQMKWLVLAVARLHNFVINEKMASLDDAPKGIAYLPTVPEDDYGDPVVIDPIAHPIYPGYSFIREEMVQRVKRHNLVRPGG